MYSKESIQQLVREREEARQANDKLVEMLDSLAHRMEVMKETNILLYEENQKLKKDIMGNMNEA